MSSKQQQLWISVAAVAATGILLVYLASTVSETSPQKKKKLGNGEEDSPKQRGLPVSPSLLKGTSTGKAAVDQSAATPLVSNNSTDEKRLHLQIEELDKKGKGLFKSKKFLDAAKVFSEALDLIEQSKPAPTATELILSGGESSNIQLSTSLNRQVITLTNNRSAMYEKGGLLELALEDCNQILVLDASHAKARTRKLRILEAQKEYGQALVQVCAMQLKFMQDNREKLRMGLPVQPPVPQQKLEELVEQTVPVQVDLFYNQNQDRKDKPLPSNHTLIGLLKSFDGYNAWMSKAAKDGSVQELSAKLHTESGLSDSAKASLYLKRGRRYAYDQKFDKATADFDAGFALIKNNAPVGEAMEDDDYARLLEWTGMAKHWKYDLDNALTCYEICSDLEPMNAGLLVKRAGVKMDGGKHDEALELFDAALGLDPNTADALLHRANLRLIQMKPFEAKQDLEQCLALRPNHILARLRLATILMNSSDTAGAKEQVDEAGKIDPNNSDVHSYRGELFFMQQEMEKANEEFTKAIACNPKNPTPYVNSALAIMNTPPTAPGQVPDIPSAMKLLEQAIEVDPQFQAAYGQLGQLKLSLATDLSVAREVVGLYDQAIPFCRTKEELKEIVSMRVLTVAQIDAAAELGMETFAMT